MKSAPPPLRFVTVSTDDGALIDRTMTEAIEALMRSVIASKPVSVAVIWETPDGMFMATPIPESPALLRGLADRLRTETHPEEGDE